jgi:CHRD domain-containing protein
MRKLAVAFLVVVVALSAVVGVQAFASKDRHKVRTVQLSGYNETPSALNSPASGTFSAEIDDQAQTITYKLTYSGFPTNVLQAHIHFGNPFAAQGVAVFLCSNLGNGPAGTPACPTNAGTVTGTLHPADVVGPVAQLIPAGAAGWPSVVKAIRAGAAYANVHTQQFPAGEIRAQLQRGHGNS